MTRPMSPTELLTAVERFLDAPDPKALPILTQNASDFADMVGWAPGPIDRDGRFTDQLFELLDRLRACHSAQPDTGIAALHDALASLGDAIARHDRDFSTGDANDDTVDF